MFERSALFLVNFLIIPAYFVPFTGFHFDFLILIVPKDKIGIGTDFQKRKILGCPIKIGEDIMYNFQGNF